LEKFSKKIQYHKREKENPAWKCTGNKRARNLFLKKKTKKSDKIRSRAIEEFWKRARNPTHDE